MSITVPTDERSIVKKSSGCDYSDPILTTPNHTKTSVLFISYRIILPT